MEDDTNMVSILESIEDVHKKLNTIIKETTSIEDIDPKDLCRIKWSLCHMKQYNRYLVTPNTNIGRKHNLNLFDAIISDVGLVQYNVPYASMISKIPNVFAFNESVITYANAYTYKYSKLFFCCRKLKEKLLSHSLNLGKKTPHARGMLVKLDNMFNFERHVKDGIKCETVLERCQI